MNKSKLAKSEIYQKCARCCKTYSEIAYDFDYVKRLHDLNTNKIKIREFNIRGIDIWRITFKIPCKHLEKNRDGKYHCSIYDSDEPRPFCCKVYPDNLNMIEQEIEKEYCPILRGLE